MKWLEEDWGWGESLCGFGRKEVVLFFERRVLEIICFFFYSRVGIYKERVFLFRVELGRMFRYGWRYSFVFSLDVVGFEDFLVSVCFIF